MRVICRIPAARVLWTGAAVAMLGGCATKGDIRDLQTELRMLALRQDSLIAQLAVEARSTQDTLRETSDQLFSFRGDISRRLREISEGIATLEALVGENQRGIAGIRDQLANVRRAPVGVPSGPELGVSGTEQVAGAAGDAEELFNSARQQFYRGSLSTARLAFEQFVEEHPSHALAPEAHFLLADILEQEGRFGDALDAFEEIPALYPTAAKVPDAMYRLALLQIEMDRTDDAEDTLQRLVNTYPDAGVALLARDKLDEIR